ncbi:hypothetical protein HPB47_021332 [Ixodes persulcatus]|uniref:Uncharacterized protein n=1 Tax=Ixodes persulcatus TaxID=34615 RepID=A0AC60QCU0_IXOPE|nr:hypothetical protein HPB47_021332 [Ixodes persulcatus]
MRTPSNDAARADDFDPRMNIARERQSRPRHRATDSAPGGLDVAGVDASTVTAAIFAAAGITGEESVEDMTCPKPQQDIVVVSTSKRANADRYTKIRQLYIQGKQHEVNAYETAPHNTNKGVIRGISVEEGHRELDEKIVNPRNSLAVAAKRIGSTTTVIVSFDGLKVPDYVRYGATLVPCSLYRKQIDDVCPNPPKRICRGCGLAHLDPDHQCTPKCSLCGGADLTADKACRARYKTPFLKANSQLSQQDFPPLHQGAAKSRSHSPGGVEGSSAASRSGSKTPSPKDKVSWANTVWGTAREGSGRAPRVLGQTQAIGPGVLEALRKENAAMRELAPCATESVARATGDQTKQTKKPLRRPKYQSRTPKKRAIEPQQEGGPEGQRFRALLQKAVKTAGSQRLIAGGRLQRGRGSMGNLAQDTQELEFARITDQAQPTRLGNSATRNMTPDLTFVRNAKTSTVTWSNTTVDLGSDHAIVAIHVPTPDRMRGSKRTFTWTDWEEFRKQRDRQQLHEAEEITDIKAWSSALVEDAKASTKTIETDVYTDKMDNRLAHLIEAKNSTLARWTKQRLNRRLRKNVAELNRSI